MAIKLNDSEILTLLLNGHVIEMVTLDSVTVARKPIVTTQPVGSSISEGESYTLVVEADGLGSTLSYQWYMNDAIISGATASSYEFMSGAASDNTFYCKVSGFGGDVDSLSVNVIVEANGSRHTLTVGHKPATLYDIWGFSVGDEMVGELQPRLSDTGDECNYLGVTAYIDGSKFGGISFSGTYKAGQLTIDIEGLDTIISTTTTNDDVFGAESYGCLFNSAITDSLLELLSANSGSMLPVSIQFVSD